MDSRESFLLAFIDGVRVRIVWNGIDILFFLFFKLTFIIVILLAEGGVFRRVMYESFVRVKVLK